MGGRNVHALIFFFKRKIGNDDAADPDFFTSGKKALIPVVENRVQVAHEHERHVRLLPQFFNHLKDFIRRGSRGKGTDIRLLDHNALCNGI